MEGLRLTTPSDGRRGILPNRQLVWLLVPDFDREVGARSVVPSPLGQINYCRLGARRSDVCRGDRLFNRLPDYWFSPVP